MNVFDVNMMALLNKCTEKNDSISFRLWSCGQFNYEKLFEISSISSPLTYEHEVSTGYWVTINVTEVEFNNVIKRIKEIFKDYYFKDDFCE